MLIQPLEFGVVITHPGIILYRILRRVFFENNGFLAFSYTLDVFLFSLLFLSQPFVVIAFPCFGQTTGFGYCRTPDTGWQVWIFFVKWVCGL